MTKTITNYSVNATGLEEIRQFLAANHRLGGDHFTPEMLSAWASDAEFSLSEGNEAIIEIIAPDCIHGRTTTYTISPAGLDSTEVKFDE